MSEEFEAVLNTDDAHKKLDDLEYGLLRANVLRLNTSIQTLQSDVEDLFSNIRRLAEAVNDSRQTHLNHLQTTMTLCDVLVEEFDMLDGEIAWVKTLLGKIQTPTTPEPDDVPAEQLTFEAADATGYRFTWPEPGPCSCGCRCGEGSS